MLFPTVISGNLSLTVQIGTVVTFVLNNKMHLGNIVIFYLLNHNNDNVCVTPLICNFFTSIDKFCQLLKKRLNVDNTLYYMCV